jgi:pimeloyl-ACP methyl ester carboxylesterase
MKLFSRQYQSTGNAPSLIILHGLFGSSDNWLPQAKMFSTQYNVYVVDLRNHGQSPHDDGFDYAAMVSDLLTFVEDHQIEDPVVLGHSMGGKAAMNFAIKHPDKLSKLIVVDIAPRAYNLEHYDIADGLKAIPIHEITTRAEADEKLSTYVPEADVRQFLLKNLQRNPEKGFSWKINLPVITDKLSNVGLDLYASGTFDKSTLFIRGSRSKYIRDEDRDRIKELFPKSHLITMDTGHWVQAEKPKEFVDTVMQWLKK